MGVIMTWFFEGFEEPVHINAVRDGGVGTVLGFLAYGPHIPIIKAILRGAIFGTSWRMKRHRHVDGFSVGKKLWIHVTKSKRS